MTVTWTPEAVRALGVRTDVETAGAILGLSRTQAYEAVKRGALPVPTFRVGRRIVVPTAPILALLGLAERDMELTSAVDAALPHLPMDSTNATDTRRQLRAVDR